MITKQNIKEVILSLNEIDIVNAINDEGDFILLECFIFNSGFRAFISSKCYNMDDDTGAGESGQLYTGKDDFLNLLNDLNINVNW